MAAISNTKKRDLNNNEAPGPGAFKEFQVAADKSMNKSTGSKKNVIRSLTGSVSMVLKWSKLIEDFVLYEVIGLLVTEVKSTSNEIVTFLLRDKKGPVLQVIYSQFYDLKLGKFSNGTLLRCYGHMVGPSKLMAYKIRIATTMESQSISRLSLISDNIVAKLVENKNF